MQDKFANSVSKNHCYNQRNYTVMKNFSNDNSMEAELRARMLAANRSFYSLKKQFTSKNLSRRTKLGLYSTYIVPVLTYASEKWTLSKSDEALLAAFERKMLRRILGLIPLIITVIFAH